MTAGVIARDLGCDLFKIDLSGVVSKYIGETEKNLDRIFRAAHSSNAILFLMRPMHFSASDRKSRTRTIATPTSRSLTSLQKVEEYEGARNTGQQPEQEHR